MMTAISGLARDVLLNSQYLAMCATVATYGGVKPLLYATRDRALDMRSKGKRQSGEVSMIARLISPQRAGVHVSGQAICNSASK